MIRRACWAILLCLTLYPAAAGAQAAPPGGPPQGLAAPPPVVMPDLGRRLKMFIDCNICGSVDFDYIRTNVTFVDHVRDRALADVHVLVTTQSTGSGGDEITLAFIGLGPFARANDELRFSTPPNTADDTIRKVFVEKLKLGLVRYVAHSSAAGAMTIGQAAPARGAPVSAPARDPWNYWVMRVRFSGNANGEEQSKSTSLSGGVSANRVTEAWKTNLSADLSYRESKYDLGDGDWYKTITRSSSASGMVVKSLGPHWSAGGRASITSSTYNNQKRTINVAPAVEYDIYPYKDSTRRIMTLQYAVGVTSFAYRELTLYDRMSETLPNHNLTFNWANRQPWGQVSFQVIGSQYLSKLDKYRFEAGGGVDLRIGKGLSFSVSGWASFIRDQLSLPKGAASVEEILVRQRQLGTSYQYGVYFSISYTFGSIYNNVVNPRFGSSGIYY